MGFWWSVLVLALGCCWTFVAGAESDEKLHAALAAVAPEKPLEVGIGVQVGQIVSINQKEENFEVVGYLRLEWDDPELAFDESEHGRPIWIMTREAFTQFVDEEGVFAPSFAIHNQQGRRFSQNSGVMVFSDGHAAYGERFTAKLQAPEFDFVRYPFDKQKFFVHVESTYPIEFMTFTPLEEFSRLGAQLGEEEWVFERSWTDTTEVEGLTGRPTSRFSFGFEARRHLNYYLLRIFLPLGIIIVVSWLTFFLQDFSKRVDIAGGNLLIFIAFNFTISRDLPRLGYMTFMDAIVLTTFVFSGLVVIMNVVFRRMEVIGKVSLARQIDNYTIWIYPVTLGGLILVCWHWFVA